MYQSLERHSKPFCLHVIAFDEFTATILEQADFKHMNVIRLQAFESEPLIKVKSSRTMGEYCWTCTPFSIQHVLEHYEVDHCTYLDADLYFFSDPSVLIDEMGASSVLLTEHRYTKAYDHAQVSGIYCVQFMTFKNTKEGLEALHWWGQRCLEWCYARVEPGLFGDQKYLDDWTTRFNGVHVLEHLGGALAPWNIQQYRLQEIDEKLHVNTQGQSQLAVFYHFHQFKFLSATQIDLGGYRLTGDVIRHLYQPYATHLDQVEVQLKALIGEQDIHGISGQPLSLWGQFKRKLLRCHNIHRREELSHA